MLLTATATKFYPSSLPCSRARISLPADNLGKRNCKNSFLMNVLHKEGVVLTAQATKKLRAKLEITCSIPQIHQSRLTEWD